MRLITICGPPSSGKTAVIVHMAKVLRQKGQSLGVVKFDCLATGDDIIYQQHHIPVQVGLSGSLCPDHFFGGNAEICLDWGKDQQFDLLLVESAGLCNRCSPHIQEQYAICVIDNLMGVDAPRKIGPMLKMADAVVVTKGDVVSQAEREVFAFHIRKANAKGLILSVSGITGQGCDVLADVVLQQAKELPEEIALRFSMPKALCSYCMGELRLKSDLQFGDLRKMEIQ